jgi:hypothetical protein
MVEEGEGSVGAVRHGENIIQKATRKHKWYRLVGIGSEGCGNYQDMFGWWHDVSCHGWGITNSSLGKTGKLINVHVIVEQTLS